MQTRQQHIALLQLAITLGLQRLRREVAPQNCVVYAGGAADRAVIREHELYHADGSRTPKFNVLLASYETVLRDKALFKSISWETVIVDEAHRMKTAGAVRRHPARVACGWRASLLATNPMPPCRALMQLGDLAFEQ